MLNQVVQRGFWCPWKYPTFDPEQLHLVGPTLSRIWTTRTPEVHSNLLHDFVMHI